MNDPVPPCDHCGLPVPAGLVESDAEHQFCCGGCRAAFQLIASSGLGDFYRMAKLSGNFASRPDTEKKFAEFDHDSFLEKFADEFVEPERTSRQITLAIEGIHCAACVWLLEKLPALAPGVVLAKVNWSQATLCVSWQQDVTPLSQIAQQLQRLGYTPSAVRSTEATNNRRKENRQQLARIGFAAAAAGNNMLIAIALYYGMFLGISPGMHWLLRIASCVVGLASLLGPGRVFLTSAWAAIRTRTAHMDLPIALGLTVGSVAGLANTVRGSGEIYFDSLSVLVFLLLVGRWIQFRQHHRAIDAVEMLYRLTPQTARKVVDEESVEILADDIAVGDTLEVRAGEIIPADGKVTSGRALVGEAILSGESRPLKKNVGDWVAAGTEVTDSTVHLRVTAVGDKTRLGGIVGLVEQASAQRPAIVQWANRIGGYFVLIVILLAILTLGIWLFIDPARAPDNAIALLIVACPCALALATPLAISVTLGRLAQEKIMVKSGDVLQRLDEKGAIWIDKTGTLTENRVSIVRWSGDETHLPLFAACEEKFSHPIARAIVEYAGEIHAGGLGGCIEAGEEDGNRPRCLPEVESKIVDGGISACVGNHQIFIGNTYLLELHAIKIASSLRSSADAILADNLAPCWFALDGSAIAVAGIGEKVRDDAALVVGELKKRGWQVHLLSGDHEQIVQRVAAEVGITSAVGAVTPEQKLEAVNRSVASGNTTVMVGDGVNDSAALAAADVGIAIHRSAEASLSAAPVYLGAENLASVIRLLDISRDTNRTIRINFAASLGYNILGAALAMTGLIHPLAAAVLMPLSSLTVIAISLRGTKAHR